MFPVHLLNNFKIMVDSNAQVFFFFFFPFKNISSYNDSDSVLVILIFPYVKFYIIFTLTNL